MASKFHLFLQVAAIDGNIKYKLLYFTGI